MIRILSILWLLALSAQSAIACDMATDRRAETVSGYVTAGAACLSAPPNDFRFDAQLEQGFLDAINRERTARGLAALRPRSNMQAGARFHSLDMGVNDFFAHQSPDGRTHHERLASFDRTLLARGSSENIAQFGPAICLNQDQREVSCDLAPGFTPPSRTLVLEDLHQKLMASPGHRDNILDPDKTHVAIGVARTGTGFYVTQVFAEYSGELSEPLPYTVDAGAALGLSARISDWSFSTFAIDSDGEKRDIPDQVVPSDLSGIAALNARAETSEMRREGDVTRTIVSWIYFSGPLVDVVPATGS